jgi:glucose-6-phosphate 1-epimerase
MADMAVLNHEYGITGKVNFKAGAGDLPLVELSGAHGNAIVALQGGHLLSWIPRGGQPVIWLSKDAKFVPGTSIRGGVPVCWPWFGPHSGETNFPAHGFARTAPWQVIAAEEYGDGGTRLVMRLEQNATTRRYWPFSTEVTLRISLAAALEIELITRNTGAAPITIGEALHTYFEVGDVREIAIRGLENCEFVDKVDSGKSKRQQGLVTFSGELDRVYLNTISDCLIDDPRLNRRIRIRKRGSRSTVVWNPWHEKAAKMGGLGEQGYLNMVCVESANAADNAVSIAVGDEHHLAAIYRVEALPKQYS